MNKLISFIAGLLFSTATLADGLTGYWLPLSGGKLTGPLSIGTDTSNNDRIVCEGFSFACAKFITFGTYTDPTFFTGSNFGAQATSIIDLDLTGNTADYYTPLYGYLYHGDAFDSTSGYDGAYIAVEHDGAGTIAAGAGVSATAINHAGIMQIGRGMFVTAVNDGGEMTDAAGFEGQANFSGGTSTYAAGARGSANISGGATIANAYGVIGSVTNSGGNVALAYGLAVPIVQGTQVAGLIMHDMTATGTAYGLYVDNIAGATEYGIYINDTAPNVLKGGLTLSSTLSAPAWTTNGIGLSIPTATYTDTTSSGNVASIYANAIATPTFAASSATTITSAAATLRIAGGPTAGSNVTISGTKYSILVNADPVGFFGGIFATGNSTINNNANGTTSIGTGTSTGAVSIGGGSNTVTVTGTTTTLAGTTVNITATNLQRNGSTAGLSRTFTATYDPASLAANTSRCDDVTVTGIATTGGAVTANIGAVDPAAGCVVSTVRASATNTVRICWRNAIDAVTACDTASSTWTFSQPQ